MVRNPNIKPRSNVDWTNIARRTVQIGFFVWIVIAAIRHNLALVDGASASIDALCPFGGLETLWRMLVEGRYIPKTHPSNIVLGLGLLIGALFAGAAFCGWICPFGTLQDGLTYLRKKVKVREIRVPEPLDRWLRYGRFVVLFIILFKTISTVQLWFADFDPYRTIFSLEWLFDFNPAEHWLAYTIAMVILVLSFFIQRAWCKYLCPPGAVLSVVGHLSFLRIRRNPGSCKGCSICNKPCPVGIAVAKANPRVSTNCIGCLACVQSCPRNATLDVQIAPSWWDGLRNLFRRLRRPAPVSGD